MFSFLFLCSSHLYHLYPEKLTVSVTAGIQNMITGIWCLEEFVRKMDSWVCLGQKVDVIGLDLNSKRAHLTILSAFSCESPLLNLTILQLQVLGNLIWLSVFCFDAMACAGEENLFVLDFQHS